MPVIDERGRLFGKLNVIDALVMLVVVVLIPVVYGAYLLFRTPRPTLTSVEPATLTQAPPPAPPVVITLRGENFRPYLRARVGTTFIPFLIETPGVAELKFPVADIPPGTYDLALFDEAQQVAVKPGALTVVAAAAAPPPPPPPPPPPVLKTEVQALGAFVGLSAAAARSIGIGSRFEPQKDAPPVAQVLAVRAPEPATQRVKVGANAFVTVPLPRELRVPAIIRLHCALVGAECKIGDAAVAQDATIMLPASAGSSQIKFVIDEVRPADARATFPSVRSAVATLHVRFVAGSEVLDVMKVGDTDVAGSGAVAEVDRAVLTQIGSERQTTTAQFSTEGLLRRSLQLQQPVLAFTGAVRVPVVYTAAGWSYKDRPVKVGAAFNFETISGAMTGWILDMEFGPER